MIEQAFIHQLQTLAEHRACLQQDCLPILTGMELKLFHIAVLLLQPVAHLQQDTVHRWLIQGCADLQCLLDVILQPLPYPIWHSLIGICQALHLLNARLGQIHQALHFLFGVILELYTKILTPQLQTIEWFIGQIILSCIDSRTAAE